MIKMILTDLDHTLLRQDGTISENTLNVLSKCRAKGILFAIATARYWIGAEKYIRQLRPDYEITTDGTLIHSDDECVYSCEFRVDETNRIVNSIFEIMPDAEITVANKKCVYWNSKHISESERLYKAVYNDYSKALDVGANKIVAELPEEKMAKEIADKEGCRLQGYRGENWYSFMPKGSDKTVAIKYLSQTSGIDMSDIVAFGDDSNDIEMLKMCGRGIAVSNAVDEVLKIADEVTLSNDEDGVAYWLMKNIL